MVPDDRCFVMPPSDLRYLQLMEQFERCKSGGTLFKSSDRLAFYVAQLIEDEIITEGFWRRARTINIDLITANTRTTIHTYVFPLEQPNKNII